MCAWKNGIKPSVSRYYIMRTKVTLYASILHNSPTFLSLFLNVALCTICFTERNIIQNVLLYYKFDWMLVKLVKTTFMKIWTHLD